MNKVCFKKLKDFIVGDYDIEGFIGYETELKTDFLGNKYHTLTREEKYLYVGNFFNNNVFISERRLLEILTSEHISKILSSEIYEHGYPESRLVPITHKEDCERCFIDFVQDDIGKKIQDILSDYF